MKFSIRHLFAFILIVVPAIGIATSPRINGFLFAAIYAFLTITSIWLTGRAFREWKTESPIRRTGSVAASTISVCAWIFLMSFLATSITRQGHRDLAEIHEIVGIGMTIVDDLERYHQINGVYPYSLEDGGITSPRTSCGYFNYVGDDAHSRVWVCIDLGGLDGILIFDEERRCWTTRNRMPWNLEWSEDAARQLGE